MPDDRSVSVVLPVCNGERYVGEAIESVLRQTRPPDEVVVVDDGSTDGSLAVVERYAPRVRHVVQPNAGVGAARNRGVELARGRFLAFLDHDDLWVEDKLDRQLEALGADPSLEAVFGLVEQFVSPDLGAAERARLHCPPAPGPGYAAGAMLIRRAAFDRVGPFETHWRVGEFLSWYLRAHEAGLRSSVLPGVVMRRRLHRSNHGIAHRGERADYARILAESLRRRRLASP